MEPQGLVGTIFAGPLALLLWIGFVVLTLVAWVKIITKAGYSGWWLLVPVSAGVLWLAAIAIGVGSLITSLRSAGSVTSENGIALPGRLDSTGLGVAGVLAIIAAILWVVSWILFFVFAFSDWPALGRPVRGPASPGGRSGDPLPFFPSPGPGTAPGWYQVGAATNDQAYWDGHGWTARKRWEGAGWVDLPLARSQPQP
jgi:hypothetical protein